MPVFFIDGEDDVIIYAESSVKRLSRLLPSTIIHRVKYPLYIYVC